MSNKELRIIFIILSLCLFCCYFSVWQVHENNQQDKRLIMHFDIDDTGLTHDNRHDNREELGPTHGNREELAFGTEACVAIDLIHYEGVQYRYTDEKKLENIEICFSKAGGYIEKDGEEYSFGEEIIIDGYRYIIERKALDNGEEEVNLIVMEVD